MDLSRLKKTLSDAIDKVFLDPVASLFYTFLALPLVYIPGHHIYSRGIRLSFVIFVAIMTIIVPSLWAVVSKNFKSFNKYVRSILLVMLALVIASTVASELKVTTVMFGGEPDYMGIIAWLSLVPFGLLFADRLKNLLFSKMSLVIMVLVMLVSLAMGIPAIAEGYRIPGLMMQATTMAMYAVLASVVALQQLAKGSKDKYLYLFGFLTSALVVVFAQSRIGYISLVMVITYFAAVKFPLKRWLTAILVGAIVLIPATQLLGGYFSRLNSDSVTKGVSYRTDIYVTSGKEVINDNLIIGNGPSALPVYLNNTNSVPEDIAKTLNEGLIFMSSHDLFLDVALYFGLITSLGLFGLFTYALLKQTDHQDSSVMKLAFVVLIINSLFNTISPEITVITFMVLFSLLVDNQHLSNKTKK